MTIFSLRCYVSSRLSRIIALAFILIFIIAVAGTGMALRNNWLLQLEVSTRYLQRNAGIVNLLIETALINASKTLHSTHTTIEVALQRGPMSHLKLHQLLMLSSREFNVHNASNDLGLMFFVNPQGMMYARSDINMTRALDMSDRFYFTDLRDHPSKQSTVGPLLLARTNGEWVFHMSVPVRDAKGEFAGVLVQQLKAANINSGLEKYTDKRDFEHLLTTYPGSPVSFVYPSASDPEARAKVAEEFKGLIAPVSRADNASTWLHVAVTGKTMLMGMATSPVLGLVSHANMGMDHVWEKFVANNKNFFVYSVLGFLLTAVIFGYLYRVSQQLADAQSTSAHDPLTRLNNRRALDEQMPLLMRESMREQTPLSVMFIDIDHFRKFNELYGHESGDVALQAVANALAGVCQRPRDFICRWGGEEFVVVLPNTTEFAAKQMAQNMLGAIQRLKLRVPHQAPPRLTVSIGHITVIVSLRTLDDDLVGAADQAMLQAKNLGRNQSVMANGTAPHPDNRMRLEPTTV